MSLPDDTRPANWAAWALRPIVLFVAAYSMVGILHEAAHAAAAYVLNVPSELTHLYVSLAPPHGTPGQRAAIRVAGPVFCLFFGLACWLAFRKAKGSRAELPLLYLTWFGVATFFGNLISTPFVGDFSGLALAFQWPMPARYAAGLVGLLLLCGLSFCMGMELRRWAPADAGRTKAMLGIVVLPAVAGTLIALLIFLPMASAFAGSRIAESSFWIFAAVGAFISRGHPGDGKQSLGVAWPDFAMLLAAIVIVRIAAGGIALVP